MNREKAIKIFKRLKENAPNEMHLETVGTAQELFDMAIQALSQEPTDENLHREREQAYMQGYEDASKRFRPKSGKWVDYRDDGFVECPFCGHATNCEDDIDELHYCFYCGAKMESEE